MDKRQQILEYMKKFSDENIAVAFSGGADSALVLSLALEAVGSSSADKIIVGKSTTDRSTAGSQPHPTKVFAVCIQTALHPFKEAEEAERLATEMGAEFRIIKVDEFRDAGIQDNPEDRCYLCKRHMFKELRRQMKEEGVSVILDGTNSDDLKVYRPGIRALKELGILSPLADCGIDKETVRELLKEAGISVASKPSTPCLATRFPYGTHLTEEALRKVEQAENIIRQEISKTENNDGNATTKASANVRVRVHGDIARIEVDRASEAAVLENRESIIEKLKTLGYTYITLDLEGFRSGSMDVHILEK